MRKLQYILNVLGYANALNKRMDDDAYEFPGMDPFYISDEEWDKMVLAFDEKFMKGEDDKTRHTTG